jgi:hypothetical protein
MVPNSYGTSDKVSWLNSINQDFFDQVKIPELATFLTVTSQSTYTLSNTIRAKNIDLVQAGSYQYRNILFENVNPTDNYFTFNNVTLTLTPAPVQNGQPGKVRYYRIATSTFTADNLTVTPDAPSEYHWIYVPGLCELISKANNDTGKSNNYGNYYRNALATASQNYSKLGA